ncbi:MAG TPA: acyl-CoA dehydrogenase family protein, partial [Acidimicrobiales bacterium]|nr:acyl-CoA dehydrogenase family protein [Acidimicrobiales bacterium]
DAGLSDPRLRPPWGRSWTRDRTVQFHEILADRKMLPPPYGMGNFLVIPTLMEHASEELQNRFIPGILDGQAGWCQLFSEPGAGSDLAGLQTRAEQDGDEWVVHGQKVWTTGGQWADLAILVARTDPGVVKHRGLSYFVMPVRQPGVEVRPLREATGEAMFNEVFLDGARIPGDWVVGDVGDGWRVTNTTLRHERAGIGGDFTGGGGAIPGTVAGHLDRPAGDLVGAAGLIGGRARRLDFPLLGTMARQRNRAGDPVVRQHLAHLYTLERITEWHMGRIKAGSAATGAEGNLAKIRNSLLVTTARDAVAAILGPDALLTGPEAVEEGVAAEHIIRSVAPSIYGGTDQIQRNIIGERALGLPREPDPSRELPFDQLLHNPVRSQPR